jgi:hypothetical protein
MGLSALEMKNRKIEKSKLDFAQTARPWENLVCAWKKKIEVEKSK